VPSSQKEDFGAVQVRKNQVDDPGVPFFSNIG
jgi:hypothetical protein